MERAQLALAVRALGNTTLVLVGIGAFVVASTAPELSGVGRGWITFSACIFVVVTVHEAARWWGILCQTFYKESEHHV